MRLASPVNGPSPIGSEAAADRQPSARSAGSRRSSRLEVEHVATSRRPATRGRGRDARRERRPSQRLQHDRAAHRPAHQHDALGAVVDARTRIAGSTSRHSRGAERVPVRRCAGASPSLRYETTSEVYAGVVERRHGAQALGRVAAAPVHLDDPALRRRPRPGTARPGAGPSGGLDRDVAVRVAEIVAG